MLRELLSVGHKQGLGEEKIYSKMEVFNNIIALALGGS